MDKKTENFIETARKIHGDKYDYSKVEYINNSTKVCIICPEHGEFWQTPNKHLSGQGCRKCGIKRVWEKRGRITTEEFINKAKKVHGDKYDYSKVEYKNNSTKICIICPIHGEFWQTPSSHLGGCGCPKCSGLERLDTQAFINRAKKVHGDKYDYSKVEYINMNRKVCIICPIHGEFWQTPVNHLKGKGCSKCVRPSCDTNSFIENAKKIHGDKYDYSKVVYNKSCVKVCIICPIHGEFWQTPNKHLSGCGCPKCAGKNMTTEDFKKRCYEIHKDNIILDKAEYISAKHKIIATCPIHGDFETTADALLHGHKCPKCNGKLTTEEWVERFKAVHGNTYSYDKTEFINPQTKVCITCRKHGDFWQLPHKHLDGRGCPICGESHLEEEVRKLLTENSIQFISQCNKATFKWLKKQSVDFYLPSYNIAIECQGKQHFTPIDFFNGYDGFIDNIERDKRKFELLKDNGVKVLYYSDYKKCPTNYLAPIYKTSEELLKEILKAKT